MSAGTASRFSPLPPGGGRVRARPAMHSPIRLAAKAFTPALTPTLSRGEREQGTA